MLQTIFLSIFELWVRRLEQVAQPLRLLQDDETHQPEESLPEDAPSAAHVWRNNSSFRHAVASSSMVSK